MRRHATVGLTLVGGLAVACLSAYAFVTTTAGHASVSVATLSPLTVTTPVTATGLYPGRTENVVVNVHNPNGFAVVVTSISAGSSAGFVNTGNSQTCNAGSVTSAAVAGAGGVAQTDGVTTTLASGATGSYSVQVSMSAPQNGNGCAGSTFSLPVSVSARSAG